MGLDFSADYWAVGCIIYHMIAGVQPFKALTPYLSMERTKKAEYTLPLGFDPVAKDLLANLFVIDASQRLGDVARGGPDALKAHSFFEGIEWDKIWTLDPPKMEAGLVKKEPPKPKKRRPRKDVDEDDFDGLDGPSNAERGAAWNALVQNLSEDDMSDEEGLEYPSGSSSGDDEATTSDDGEGTIGALHEDDEREDPGPPAESEPAPAEVVPEQLGPGTPLTESAVQSLTEQQGDSAPRSIRTRTGDVVVWDAQYPNGAVPPRRQTFPLR